MHNKAKLNNSYSRKKKQKNNKNTNLTFVNDKGKRINNKRITVKTIADGQEFVYTGVEKVVYQEIRNALEHSSNNHFRGI